MKHTLEEIKNIKREVKSQFKNVKLCLSILLVTAIAFALAGIYILIAISFFKGLGCLVVSTLSYLFVLSISKEVNKQVDEFIDELLNE